ncbi:transmembrane protein 41A [Seminavis robusta]|uniref:Transmembrane protein 41A n=1 Tax=Seminavis robusta TaxID=568900 RepID=A0A9N8HMF7_9STRA|nr:transmembrane protein 41A [Seminavis robusta]|eukprot:Sro902_g218160.1 transmembrane protein 41A (551) ;mRNA; f:30758-32501
MIRPTDSFVPSGLVPSTPVSSSGSPLKFVERRKGRQLFMSNREDKDEAAVEEEVRLKILDSRRKQVRTALKAAESLRNFRLSKGFVPELDENGKPLQSDGKLAVSLTAFVVAGGAVALRVGGRAALVSAVGLDFVTDNPELKQNLDQILTYADTMDPLTKGAAFVAAWTAVKVFCVDFAGVALALASGILFGGVLQGALASAGAATIGSCVAFSLAKLDTPVRKKSLELLDEYPSLRGIEKVVARDGLKAILTLRLAPVLPIPIGMYNYIYGVTKVPVFDFAGGIFLGSLKPYLLDSYLGFFGKSVVDGSISAETSWQDIILLVALGVSVLIGVFASQLAAETWESVLEEVEAEKAEAEGLDPDEVDDDDGIVREVAGVQLPQWIVGFQLALQQGSDRVNELILDEFEAQVWNYTKEEPPPADIDPAYADTSPEVVGANKGIDYVGGLCDGLVLTPSLFSVFLKYSDPLYNEEEDEQIAKRIRLDPSIWLPQQYTSDAATSASSEPTATVPSIVDEKEQLSQKTLLSRLDDLESRAKRRLDLVNERLEDL